MSCDMQFRRFQTELVDEFGDKVNVVRMCVCMWRGGGPYILQLCMAYVSDRQVNLLLG